MRMRKEAESILSEPVTATLTVAPRGLGQKSANQGAADAVGGLLGKMLRPGFDINKPTTPGNYQQAMLMAVTGTRVAFFPITAGSLGDLIVTYPLAEIRRFEWRRGKMVIPFVMSRPVEIELANGTVFHLEAGSLVFYTNHLRRTAEAFEVR